MSMEDIGPSDVDPMYWRPDDFRWAARELAELRAARRFHEADDLAREIDRELNRIDDSGLYDACVKAAGFGR